MLLLLPVRREMKGGVGYQPPPPPGWGKFIGVQNRSPPKRSPNKRSTPKPKDGLI